MNAAQLNEINDWDKVLDGLTVRGQKLRVDGSGLKQAIGMVLKSISSSTLPGLNTQLTEINLDPLVKHVYPIQTPFLNGNLVGQKGGQFGEKYQYRAISSFNQFDDSGAAVEASGSGYGRGRLTDIQTLPREKFFSKLMPEWSVSRELARLSGVLKAYAQNTIASLANAKIIEEQNLLFSRRGTVANPVGLAATGFGTGGSLAAGTYSVQVTALNYWGARRFPRLADGITIPTLGTAGAGKRATESAGSTAVSGIVLAGATSRIDATWTISDGAWGYAVYLNNGTTNWLVGISNVPAFSITSNIFPGLLSPQVFATPTANATDVGVNHGVVADGITADETIGYDGLYSQIVLDPDIPGEYLKLAASGFTPTTGGSGIAEFEDIFERLFRKRGVNVTCIVVSPFDWKAISAMLTSSTSQNYRINVDSGDGARVAAGVVVDAIKNQFARDIVDVVVHPLMPPGKVMFYTRDLPYENNNTGVNLTHFFNERMNQIFFPRNKDVAEPGPWGISTIGTPVLTYPRACAAIDGYKSA